MWNTTRYFVAYYPVTLHDTFGLDDPARLGVELPQISIRYGLSRAPAMSDDQQPKNEALGTPEASAPIANGNLFKPENAARQETVSPHASPANRGTILVVDDQTELRQLISEMLICCGYEAIEAANGAEALNILQQNTRVTAILTDIVMPEMNGLQLTAQLEILGNRIPVIYMSGFYEGLDAGKRLAMSGARILQKPFQMHELLNSLEALPKRPPSDHPSDRQ